MRKIIFSIIILVMFLYCVFGMHKTQYGTEITFASWGSESEISILKPILKAFETENPDIKVNFMHIPQNYFQKIHLLYASKTEPDVIFVNNLYLPVYANAGVLENLSPFCKQLQCDKFYTQAINSMKYDGKLYAIPRDISNMIVFYNKDLFKKYNVPFPNKDWTFEDFLFIAKKITHKPNIFGVSFEEKPLYYLPFLTSNGGWTKEDVNSYFSKNVLNSRENKIGLNFYSSLRKNGYAPLKNESASATMAQMFLQEKIGMHISGRWLVPKYRQDAKFDWDVVQFPKGTKGSIVPLDSSGWAISKNSKHKQEALMLIKYLSSDKNMKKITCSGLIVPARIETADSDAFLNNEKPLNSKAFLDTIKTATPTPVTVNYNEIIDDLQLKTEHLFNDK